MSWSVEFVRWGVCMGALVGVCTCVLRRTVVSVLVVHLGGIPKGCIPGTAVLRNLRF